MNTKLVLVVFCVFQVSSGQDELTPEQEILERISNTDIELEFMRIDVDETVTNFAENVRLENEQLEILNADLRVDLTALATELSTEGVNITDCVVVVELNISTFVNNARERLLYFSLTENKALLPTFHNESIFYLKHQNLVSSTLQGIDDCNILDLEEERNDCINALLAAFSESNDEIMTNISDLRASVQQIQVYGTQKLSDIMLDIQNEIDHNVEFTRGELSLCIENSNIAQ